MYNQTHNNASSYSYPPLDQLELEFEGSNMAGYCANYSSSSSSYGGSPTSNSMGAFESLSLRKGSSSSLHVLPEDSSQNAHVRRVYSASDLESVNSYMAMRRSLQRAESPLSISNENNLIIEGILKATKYTPQEKKERIERYRNKRNQRNFHKKIQYTCRKTLADSRPRIKGRFVRNDEISTSPITSTNIMTTTDGNYTTTIGSCYDGDYSLLNDQYSSTHHHQQHMMNVREELEDECEEEINYNWVNLFDCSFPISSQYEH